MTADLNINQDHNAEHESLLQFLYMAPVGLIQLKTNGEVIMINPLATQLLMPIKPDGDMSNFFSTIENVAPDLRNICTSFSKKRGQICDSLRVQLMAGIPGKQDPKILAVSLLKLDAERMMAVISDVTIVVKRERQLQQNEAWFNAIFSGVTDYALLSLDHEGKVDKWNLSVERVCNFKPIDVENMPYSIFFPADAMDSDRLKDRLADADANGWSLAESWCVKSDGSKFWGSSIIAPLVSSIEIDKPQGYSLIIRDISEKQNSVNEILNSIYSDHLTGVLNRRGFYDAANIEFDRYTKRARPLSILVIDADFFKKINDTYGHPVGDEVLKHLASSLKECVRDMDVVARLGGEEFSILLPSTDILVAAQIAERMRKLIAESKLNIDGHEIRYTVSIGVSAVSQYVTGIDTLIKIADQALYQSKNTGRNRITIITPTESNLQQ